MKQEKPVYNNIIFAFKDLADRLKNIVEDKETITQEELIPIVQEFEGLIDMLDDPIIGSPLNNFTLEEVNKIDLFNLGRTVLSYKKLGQTFGSIAKLCSQQSGERITRNDVQAWIEEFDQKSISGKQRVIYGSVFDTTDRLEEIYIAILQLRDTIREKDNDYYKSAKVVKEQVELELMRELRQVIGEAEKLASKIQMAKDIQRFTNLVLSCLKKEAPMVHTRVLTLLREEQAAFKQLVSS